MPGSSASHLIWFIAAITVAIGVVSALTASVLEVSEGLESRTDALSGELRADIEIINDPGSVPYESSTDTLHVYIKNTGSVALDLNADMMVIFVNGSASAAQNITLVGSSSIWAPGLSAQVEFPLPGLTEGSYYHMKVTASQYEGVWDEMDFMVMYV